MLKCTIATKMLSETEQFSCVVCVCLGGGELTAIEYLLLPQRGVSEILSDNKRFNP